MPNRPLVRPLLVGLVFALAAGCDAEAGNGEDPRAAAAPRLRAGFLVVDGVYNTELTAPWDVLEHTLHHLPGDGGVEVVTISPDGGSVTTAEGLEIGADHGFDDAPELDILVVPSARGSRDEDLENREMVEWVRATGAEATYVVSLCWGSFVLAEAGLLDGVGATTFLADYDTFAQRYPQVDLRVNVSFVHAGKTITSQGGVRSFDAAMYLTDLLYGSEVAAAIGRGLLIPWPQPDLAHISDRLPAGG